jgi:predicted DNA-binding transcriptional regulator AlpA
MRRTATESDYVSVAEAARITGFDRRTVWKWIKSKVLKSFTAPSGRTVVRRRDLVKPRIVAT